MPRRTQISFATFNLYNLNLPDIEMYRDADGWTREQYEKKIAWSAKVLKDVNARVWGFQELWHADALKEVFQRAGLSDKYDLLVPPDHTGDKIVCAAAVEKGLVVDEPTWIGNFHEKFILDTSGEDKQTSDIHLSITKFSRPPLKFKIRPRADGSDISVYVCHFKSKRPTEIYREGWYREDADFYKKHRDGLGYTLSAIRRSAEAAALRMFVVEEIDDTETPLVVLGDLNNEQRDDTLNILTGQPNYLLSGLSQGGSDTALYSVSTLQEYRSLRNVFYTHIYQNIRESLDHILVSQEFYDNSRKRLWAYKGMENVNDHLNDEDHKELGTSDHGIVKATFEYRPA